MNTFMRGEANKASFVEYTYLSNCGRNIFTVFLDLKCIFVMVIQEVVNSVH